MHLRLVIGKIPSAYHSFLQDVVSIRNFLNVGFFTLGIFLISVGLLSVIVLVV